MRERDLTDPYLEIADYDHLGDRHWIAVLRPRETETMFDAVWTVSLEWPDDCERPLALFVLFDIAKADLPHELDPVSLYARWTKSPRQETSRPSSRTTSWAAKSPCHVSEGTGSSTVTEIEVSVNEVHLGQSDGNALTTARTGSVPARSSGAIGTAPAAIAAARASRVNPASATSTSLFVGRSACWRPSGRPNRGPLYGCADRFDTDEQRVGPDVLVQGDVDLAQRSVDALGNIADSSTTAPSAMCRWMIATTS